ncbi:MAG: phenylalanine--tRNA ligase subunit beta [Gammaproteobacteria bacterium]
MKINEHWLREWVDPMLDRAEIAERLTLAGLEVDSVESVARPLPGVVVAEVLAVEAHPDAERLVVCRIRDGLDERTVVCGAPNVRAGLRVPYARPGAELPGARAITASDIRGVTSAGMLCSAAELGLGDDAAGLLELDGDAEPGLAIDDVLRLDDAVFDIGLTPNRGDCFCVLGIARDLAVISGAELRAPDVAQVPPVDDAIFAVDLSAPTACPRYAGRVVKGLDPAARTPLWMRERLRRCGVRSIHPVVDITNYVMLELGQPMHGFDLQRLHDHIGVREAVAGESLLLLDGQVIDLEAGTLVIADGNGPVALAGVMGGEASGVGDDTVDVFLESAFFEPVRLAGVARRYRLQTDASTRFERGVDPSGQERALERATALVLAICGGRPGPVTVIEMRDHVPQRAPIAFRPQAVDRLLGTTIPSARIADILVNLQMTVTREGEGCWQVAPPAFRFDIAIEADLVEEVARINGYDQIPVRLPGGAGRPDLPPPAGMFEDAAREALIGRGYFEAITYSFIAADKARLFAVEATSAPLANPISRDMAVMRPSMWPALVDAAMHNLNRRHDDVRLFEIGAVFAGASAAAVAGGHRVAGLRCGVAQTQHWDGRARDADFFDAKRDVEAVLARCHSGRAGFLPAEHPALHPGQTAAIVMDGRRIGFLGALHPRVAREMDVDRPLFLFDLALPSPGDVGTPQFAPFSRFPAVRRDLSLVVDEHILAADCLAAAREGAGPILRDLQLFDVYRGQGIDSGKKSLTLGLIFQVASSTLTDDEVEASVARILTKVQERVGGILRK